MSINQRGVSVVGLLAVAAVGVMLCAIGWLVYDHHKSHDKSNVSSGQQTTQNHQTPRQAAHSPTQPQTKYFEIKELGVKFETNADLDGLYYVIGNNNNTAYFSLDSLRSTGCAANKTPQIALSRYTEADLADDPQGEAIKPEAKKLGDYYYMTFGGQAACSEDTAVQAKASDLRSKISDMLPAALMAD